MRNALIPKDFGAKSGAGTEIGSVLSAAFQSSARWCGVSCGLESELLSSGG